MCHPRSYLMCIMPLMHFLNILKQQEKVTLLLPNVFFAISRNTAMKSLSLAIANQLLLSKNKLPFTKNATGLEQNKNIETTRGPLDDNSNKNKWENRFFHDHKYWNMERYNHTKVTKMTKINNILKALGS